MVSCSERDDQEQTQDTLGRLNLLTILGMPGVPPDKMEEMTGEREVWACCPHDPALDKQ